MDASENPDLIEGRLWFIVIDILEYEEAVEDGSIDDDGATLDEDYYSGLV